MKKLLSLLMLLALMVSCSSDDDNTPDTSNEIPIDTKLIKTIELIDITNGQEKTFGEINFKYDKYDQLVNVKVEESDYISGENTSIKETMFSYDDRKISFSTMNEEGFKVWLSKGFFELDKRGMVEEGEITEGSDDPRFFTYKYDNDRLLSTHSRTKGYVTKTAMEWSTENIAIFEWIVEKNENKERTAQYERVDYNNYYNNASIDLARLICFGYEGSTGVSLMCGAEEGNYLNIIGRRVKNMPSRMTVVADGAKIVKDFEYSRDPNNRIYEIKVKKVSTYINEQTETREYKYLIGY